MLPLWAGDAALGDGRPPIEHALKGALVAFVLISFAIVVWRRRHHRAKEALSPSAANPEQSTG
jgi:hypothetical protein